MTTPINPDKAMSEFFDDNGWNEEQSDIARVIDLVDQICTLRYELQGAVRGSYAEAPCGMRLDEDDPNSIAEMLRSFASNLEHAANSLAKGTEQ